MSTPSFTPHRHSSAHNFRARVHTHRDIRRWQCGSAVGHSNGGTPPTGECATLNQRKMTDPCTCAHTGSLVSMWIMLELCLRSNSVTRVSWFPEYQKGSLDTISLSLDHDPNHMFSVTIIQNCAAGSLWLIFFHWRSCAMRLGSPVACVISFRIWYGLHPPF